MKRKKTQYKGPSTRKQEILDKYNLTLDRVVNSRIDVFYEMVKNLSEEEMQECKKIRKQEKNRVSRARERERERNLIEKLEMQVQQGNLREREQDKEDADASIQLDMNIMELKNECDKILQVLGLNTNEYTVVKNKNGELGWAKRNPDGTEPPNSVLYCPK